MEQKDCIKYYHIIERFIDILRHISDIRIYPCNWDNEMYKSYEENIIMKKIL